MYEDFLFKDTSQLYVNELPSEEDQRLVNWPSIRDFANRPIRVMPWTVRKDKLIYLIEIGRPGPDADGWRAIIVGREKSSLPIYLICRFRPPEADKLERAAWSLTKQAIEKIDAMNTMGVSMDDLKSGLKTLSSRAIPSIATFDF